MERKISGERPSVIVIDMLNDFVTGKLATKRANIIIDPIGRLLNAARDNDVPVIYSNDSHFDTDAELEKWGEHAIRGTKGAEVIPELEPRTGDYVIPKTTYNGFFETNMDSLLRSQYGGKSVDALILTGLHSHMCVRHTAAGGFFRGYKIVVPEDGVDAFTEEAHRSGIDYLRETYGAKITTVDDVIEEMYS